MDKEANQSDRSSRARFATTHWSVVLTAGDRQDSRYTEALQTLCQTYWYPLYAYARQQGYSAPDAEDLTQAFVVKLIERNLARIADRARGRFRSFLLTAFKNFIADQRSRQRTRKRGGRACVLSMDLGTAETRYQREPADSASVEDEFERRWALAVLETVYKRLQSCYEADGKGDLFDQLKPCLTQASSALSYVELAARLKQSEGALRVAVHRLRKRYRDLLRAEIEHTVSDPAHVEDEIHHLFRALA